MPEVKGQALEADLEGDLRGEGGIQHWFPSLQDNHPVVKVVGSVSQDLRKVCF